MNSAPVLVFGTHARRYRPNAGASVARALPERCGFMSRRLCYQPSVDVKGRGGAPSEAGVGLTALADFDRISGP